MTDYCSNRPIKSFSSSSQSHCSQLFRISTVLMTLLMAVVVLRGHGKNPLFAWEVEHGRGGPLNQCGVV